MPSPGASAFGRATESGLAAGVENLLVNCLGAVAGQTILIVREEVGQSYYCPKLCGVVAAAARARGIAVETFSAPVLTEAEAPPPALAAAMAAADHTVFLARIGDQLRFRPSTLKNPPVVSYALDGGMLGSAYGATDHNVFLALKSLIDAAAESAGTIRITCPLGTDIAGRAMPVIGGGDVTVKRFPMPVFRPVSASGFSGRVALRRWLIGSGSRFYKPYAQCFDGVVLAEVEAGRIVGFDGPAEAVRLIRAHYDRVAGMFGCDRDVVHSWHAGIHPGCAYPTRAEADFERWGGGAFGNPRMLHFHTCGDYAPGEICWSVFDATVTFDGAPFWDHGRLMLENIPGAQDAVDACPEAAALFANPARNIGV
jgi:hypothetical protein